MKKLRPFILTFICLIVAACNTVTTPIARFKGQSEQQIFQGGVHDMLHHNYSGASDHFEALNALYPFGQNAEQAQLDIIYAYYQQDDLASTLAAADRFIHLYPRGKNADYAYYMRGVAEMQTNVGVLEHFFPSDPASRDLTGLKKAFMDFDMLLKGFPHSKYTPDAVQRMVFIRNVLAHHQLLVANYYFKRQLYVAAANRANTVLEQYQESPSVPEALVVMAQCYRKLGLTKQLQQTMETLQLNFPNSQYLKDAVKKL